MGQGLHVTCQAWAPKQQNRQHEVSRLMCLMLTKEHCTTCPNVNFNLQVTQNLGNQEVSCPRWRGCSRLLGDNPTDYVQVPRETCLTTRPFEFCSSCPNSGKDNLPHVSPHWYEARNKR